MQDRPTAVELLDAVANFLVDDVVPDLSDRKRFHTRVASNLLSIVAREWRLEAEHRAADRAALVELLAADGTADELWEQLALGVRDGGFDDRQQEVLDVLRGVVGRKLLVNRPAYALDIGR